MKHLPWMMFDTQPHSEQRYDTCGDYYPIGPSADKGMSFKVSCMRDWRSEAAVALHEYIEWCWCQQHGVTQEAIDAWDFAHPDVEDPGELAGCPYREGHRMANNAELIFVESLGLSWTEHGEIVADATKDYRRPLQIPAKGPPAAAG